MTKKRSRSGGVKATNYIRHLDRGTGYTQCGRDVKSVNTAAEGERALGDEDICIPCQRKVAQRKAFHDR